MGLELDGLVVSLSRCPETHRLLVCVSSEDVGEDSGDAWPSGVPCFDLVVNDSRATLMEDGEWVSEDVAELVRKARAVCVAWEDAGLDFYEAQSALEGHILRMRTGPPWVDRRALWMLARAADATGTGVGTREILSLRDALVDFDGVES